MRKLIICYSVDVDYDVVKFLKQKNFKCIKIKNFDNNIEKLINSDIYITKYTDLPKFLKKDYNLKMMQLTTSDHSKIDKKFAKKKNIIITNNEGANSSSVSEHVFGLLLAIKRNLIIQNLNLKYGKWINLKNQNIELEKKKIGIIGMGNTGAKVCRLAHAFNMDVYFNEIDKEKIKKFKNKFIFKSKEFIYKNCDIISLHVDLNKTTLNMIDIKILKKMKINATLINTSRGHVINESQLYIFLKKNPKFQACLDVFQNEKEINKKLINLPNVLSTPHSGPSKETRLKLCNNILNNVNLLKNNKIEILKKKSINYKNI